MNMDPVPHADPITQVTDSLVQNFVKPLYDSCNEKNYFAYVRCLSQIVDWSYEFFVHYSHKMKDWEEFERSRDNIFNSVSPDEFLRAWGQYKIQQFNAGSTSPVQAFDPES